MNYYDEDFDIVLELSSIEKDELGEASTGVDAGFGHRSPGVNRYVFYRRCGHDKSTAIKYALAWARNATEQYERRLGHDTGAEGWRKIEA